MASAKIKSLNRMRNAFDKKQAKLLSNFFLLSQFNYWSITWLIFNKTSDVKLNIKRRVLLTVHSEPHTSLEELLNLE